MMIFLNCQLRKLHFNNTYQIRLKPNTKTEQKHNTWQLHVSVNWSQNEKKIIYYILVNSIIFFAPIQLKQDIKSENMYNKRRVH